MATAVMKYQVLNEILRPLAERFEAGDAHGLKLDSSHMNMPESLEECLAELIAEGWLERCSLLNRYKLTEEGYQHFLPRLRALQML